MSKIKFNYEYLTSTKDLNRVKTWLDSRKFFVFDTETSGLNVFQDELVILQIGDDTKQWLIDCRAVNPVSLGPYFASPDILKIGQNLKFDLKFTIREYGWEFNSLADTMLIEQVIRCGLKLRASMEVLAKYYLRLDLDKDVKLRTSFGVTPIGRFSKRQLEYAAGDCIYPLYIIQKQKPIIKKRQLIATVNLEHEVLPVIAKAELEGMKLNVNKWISLYQTSLEKRNVAEKELDKFFGAENYKQDDFFGKSVSVKNINYGSPEQIVNLLRLKGYEVEGTEQADLILGYLNKVLPKSFVQPMLTYRLFKTRVERYGLNVVESIEQSTGHIHTEFLQANTATGRLSSGRETGESTASKKQLSSRKAKRINFQNLPHLNAYRNCIEADPGYKLIIQDYSAIEPRILAKKSNDRTYVRTFENDLDIYQEIGEQIYHEEVSKKPGNPLNLRNKTKIGVLGTSYGTGKPKFFRKMQIDLNFDRDTGQLKDEIVVVTKEESDSLWEGIFITCPDIREALNIDSSLANPRASRRKFYDHRLSEESYTKVYDRLMGLFEDDEYLDESQAHELAAKLALNRAYISYSESLGGRKRFYRVYHMSWWTDGRNHPIQATASDIIKTAMVSIDKRIKQKGHDAVIINQVHDELIVKVREDQAEEVNSYVSQLMIEAGDKYLDPIPCKVEGGICDQWEK